MSEHTPGLIGPPLQSGDHKCWGISGSSDDYYVNLECEVDSDDKDPEVAAANARRLVACWNACAGLPTEALESGCLTDNLDARIRSLLAVNAALVAACNEALAWIAEVDAMSRRFVTKEPSPSLTRIRKIITAAIEKGA